VKKTAAQWDLRDLLSGFESAEILQLEMEMELQLESETIANVCNARFRMEESKWKWDETMAELGMETDIYEFRVGVSGCRVGYCKAGFGEKWLTPRRLRGDCHVVPLNCWKPSQKRQNGCNTFDC